MLAFVFVWYCGFIARAGYATDFMGVRLIDGFTVGYATGVGVGLGIAVAALDL